MSGSEFWTSSTDEFFNEIFFPHFLQNDNLIQQLQGDGTANGNGMAGVFDQLLSIISNFIS